MLKRTKNGMDFSEAQVDDAFDLIEYSLYSYGPSAVKTYVVIRVGKRDVVCENTQNRPEQLRITKKQKLAHAHLHPSDEVKKALQLIRLKSKRNKVIVGLTRRLIEQMPEALCDQIIAFVHEKKDA